MSSIQVIIRPIISEKSMSEAGKSKYTFEVRKDASKGEIKAAVMADFSVDVEGIQTTIVKGRSKRVGKRREEVTSGKWKKAVVSLKSGQKIDMFSLSE